MGSVAAVAALMAPIIRQVVQWIRGIVDPADTRPSWMWVGGGLAVGVVGAIAGQVDVTAVPLDAPVWLVRSYVGLAAGALASGFHDVVQRVKAGTTAAILSVPLPVSADVLAVEGASEAVDQDAMKPKPKPGKIRRA